jgi:hypothetical protein
MGDGEGLRVGEVATAEPHLMPLVVVVDQRKRVGHLVDAVTVHSPVRPIPRNVCGVGPLSPIQERGLAHVVERNAFNHDRALGDLGLGRGSHLNADRDSGLASSLMRLPATPSTACAHARSDSRLCTPNGGDLHY